MIKSLASSFIAVAAMSFMPALAFAGHGGGGSWHGHDSWHGDSWHGGGHDHHDDSHSSFSFALGFGGPIYSNYGYGYGGGYYAAPVYAPPPVVYAPPPVVYSAPAAPPVVYSAPVYYSTPVHYASPGVSFSVGATFYGH